MTFISTRGYQNSEDNFLKVVQMGLAPDGGLFLPKEFPKISLDEIDLLQDLSYQERLFLILQKFELAIPEENLIEMIEKAYSDFNSEKICPLSELEENTNILELFHGPTASFKDMGLQLTPHFFDASKENIDEKFCIVTATSGDTGIAAIEGFKKIENMSVFIIYPKDGVSDLQKKQMQSVSDKNVKVMGVDGDFDFCQNATKQLFTDEKFTQKIQENFNTKFAAGNSMNWGRLLPQIGYYFSAYADLLEQKKITLGEEIEFCVPSGNFGNILGAFMAKKMGLPISKFICASNENNILTEFLNTGIYDISEKSLIKTDSPSIDILKSSNIERLLYFLTEENPENTIYIKNLFEELNTNKKFEVTPEILEKIKESFVADFSTESEMQETIKKYSEEKSLILDPHTAVAVCVSDKTNLSQNTQRIIASTAHFGKFTPAIEKALEKKLSNISYKNSEHKKLLDIQNRKSVQTDFISNSYSDLLHAVENFLEIQKKK